MEKREGFFGRFFGISQSGSNMRTEILAGITTFITVAYILILNPQILADPFVITGDVAMAAKVSNGVFIGTCIGAFIGTFLCAVYAKVPLAQAPGMGLNAFFAYTVVLGMGYTYNQTLTIVFLSGVLFIVITVVGLRQAIIRAIPESIKMAITEKCRYRCQQSVYTGKYGRLCTVEKWWEYRTDLRSTGCFIRSDRDQCFKCKKSKRLYLFRDRGSNFSRYSLRRYKIIIL